MSLDAPLDTTKDWTPPDALTLAVATADHLTHNHEGSYGLADLHSVEDVTVHWWGQPDRWLRANVTVSVIGGFGIGAA